MAEQKIKILFLIDSLAGGGTQQALFDLCGTIDKSIFSVHVLSLTADGDVYSERIKKHAEVYFLKEQKNSATDFLNPTLWKKISGMVKDIKPTILHARLNGSLLFASILSRVLKIKPFMFTIEGSCKQHPAWIGAYYRLFFRNANSIFTNYPKEYEKMNLPLTKLRKYEGGIRKPEKIKEPANQPIKPGAHPVLLSVGRLHPDKGHAFAIQVMSELTKKFPQAFLIICGEGGHRAVLENRIQKAGLADHVFLAGYVAEPDWFYTKADFYLNFSVNEPPNLSNLRALMYSVPTIAFQTESEPFYKIENGVNGYLVSNRDAQGAADKISQLCEDTSAYQALRQKTEESFDQNLLYQTVVKKVEKFYVGAVSR